MIPSDHSHALERIARDCNQSPLVVLELFLERAAIREYEGGFTRAEAEQLALADTADALCHPGTQQRSTTSGGAS